VKDKDMRERIQSRSDFTDYCSLCGIALTNFEVTADIQGNLILFDEKTTGSIQMSLCADCKNKVLEIALGGLNAAIQRRLNIDNAPHSHTKVKRTKKVTFKDDEGDGGAAPKI